WRRIHRAPAAEGHAPLSGIHQAGRTRRMAACGRTAAAGRQRHGLRAVAQPRPPEQPHRDQLPGLRGQAGPGMTTTSFPPAVLFDLDGTLLDSAPDFIATANRMREARGMQALPLEQLRPVVSKGSRAMLAVAFPQM